MWICGYGREIQTHVFSYLHECEKKKDIDEGVAKPRQDKLKVAAEHFSEAFGASMERTRHINWSALGYAPFNLVDSPFTMQELSITTKAMPAEKAPGPDGFIGVFYKKCWEVTKFDLYESMMGFYNHKTSKMHLINEANIVLLPKKQDLATRLASRMNELVSEA